MTFDVILQQLAAGFGKTLLIFFLTLAFSLPLGLLVCLGRMSRWAPFRALGKPGCTAALRRLASFRPLCLIFKFCISILRGTPLMLQLFLSITGFPISASLA